MTKFVCLLGMAATFVLLPWTTAAAVEFGPNSGKITNTYFPVQPGVWSHHAGAGNWIGRITYANAVGLEKISGAIIGSQTFNDVECVKINFVQTEPQDSDTLLSLWFAQDTDGNVWVMKILEPVTGNSFLLGHAFYSQFMPADPTLGDPAAFTIPQDASNFCEVQQVNVDLVTTFDSYENCINVLCFHDSPEDTEAEYYCPNIGLTRRSTLAEPSAVLDLFDFGMAAQKGAVIIPLGE